MHSFRSVVLTSTIPSGSAVSSAIKIGDNALVSVVVPAGVTVSFQGSMDNTTFRDIRSSAGVEYTATCSTSGWLTVVDPYTFLAPIWVKLRLGSAASPSTASADTTVVLITKEV